MADTKPRIGIIGGTGWLGSAIARRCLETGVLAGGNLMISCRSGVTDVYDCWPDVRITDDNQALVEASDIIILSVRPEQFSEVSIKATGKLVNSLMAGRTAALVGARTGCDRNIRAMPNAAAGIGLSYTPWWASSSVTTADRAASRLLFAAIGLEDECRRESDIDYFTGLTGSGPAFFAAFADAMIRHAEASGMESATARRAVRTLLAGASRMLAEEEPKTVVENYRAYRGTTAAGLDAMMAAGLAEAIGDGLEAAEAKARELSGKP